MSEETHTGTVRWFSDAKGYGFIKQPNGGDDIFVHCNQLRRSGIMRNLL